MLASICFAIWGIVVLNISLDTTLWNLLLLAINFFFAIPLLWRKLPTPLNKFYKPIYNDYFKSFFTKKQFKSFMSHGKTKKYKTPGNFVCEAGNPLSHYYFIVDLPKGSAIEVLKNDVVIGECKVGSWVGIVDGWD